MVGSDVATLIESWKEEESRPFTGWDFSYLDGRMLEDQPPWSYLTRADELMCQSTAVLDMGTGGGERLLRLREHWPGKVVTEDHPPNVALARERLPRRRVDVRSATGRPLDRESICPTAIQGSTATRSPESCCRAARS